MQTKRSKSYLKVIDTAKKLFWKHGISRITVEELCKEARISKMTFYRYFNNKNEVAQRVLESEFEIGMEEYRSIMMEKIPFEEKIKSVVLLKQKGASGISNELIKDIYSKGEEGLLSLIEKNQQMSMNEFIKDLEDAQKKGEIRMNLKPEFILHMLNNINEKMKDNNFLDMYENTPDAIMELTNFFFYGILSKEK